MRALAEEFLKSKNNAWSDSTLRSEASRLYAVLPSIDGNPETLWKALQSKKPYTRVTTWTRVVTFWDWLIQKGHRNGSKGNVYSQWRSENARFFKGAYDKKPAKLTLAEAIQRIEAIGNAASRQKAKDVLPTGMRFSESLTLDPTTGIVIGKGGKPRVVPNGKNVGPQALPHTYQSYWRHLKAVGLTPHMIRKIVATHVYQTSQPDDFTFCAMFGWNDIRTARSYVGSKPTNPIEQNLINDINKQQTRLRKGVSGNRKRSR